MCVFGGLMWFLGVWLGRLVNPSSAGSWGLDLSDVDLGT